MRLKMVANLMHLMMALSPRPRYSKTVEMCFAHLTKALNSLQMRLKMVANLMHLMMALSPRPRYSKTVEMCFAHLKRR